jgi:DNA-binding response OmpR family regulator
MSAAAVIAWGPTVLLVEDDDSIAQLVCSYLGAQGFRVRHVRTGEEALADLEQHPVRIVVLDLGLPGMDGFDVCRAIRYRSNVPVVILTARDEEVDRVMGLELGADDYVPKPFSPRELAARLKAVLRRAEDRVERNIVELGEVVLNRDRREVAVADQPINLTAREFDLLAFLLENPGIVFTRDQLLDRVWDMSYESGTRTVDMHVAGLRRKLGLPGFVQTVRGVGYRVSAR